MKTCFIPLFFFAAVCSAATIDTTAIYWSGINPSVAFRFNEDGQAFTADGIQVTFVSFGVVPQVPCEWCFLPPPPPMGPPQPPSPPPPPIDPPCPPVVPSPTPPPASDTPEPATWIVGAALTGAGLKRWRA